MPAPAHLISKIGDPIFAVFIGLSAAATRINREEKEQGRSTQETIDAGLRYDPQLISLVFLFNSSLGESVCQERKLRRTIKCLGKDVPPIPP